MNRLKRSSFAAGICYILLTVFTGCQSTHSGTADVDTPLPVETVVPVACGTVRNLHRIGDIYVSGQPTPDDFALLQEMGIQTVITLRHDKELEGFDERQAVEAVGMQYIELPFNGAEELTFSVFTAARESLLRASGPILVHCGSANRVGAVWLPYRVLDEGVAYEEALPEAKAIGLRNPEYEKLAQAYIEKTASEALLIKK